MMSPSYTIIPCEQVNTFYSQHTCKGIPLTHTSSLLHHPRAKASSSHPILALTLLNPETSKHRHSTEDNRSRHQSSISFFSKQATPDTRVHTPALELYEPREYEERAYVYMCRIHEGPTPCIYIYIHGGVQYGRAFGRSAHYPCMYIHMYLPGQLTP